MKKPHKYQRAEPPTEAVPPSSDEIIFTDETIIALKELGAALEPIYRRLRAEGYIIKDDEIFKKDDEVDRKTNDRNDI